MSLVSGLHSSHDGSDIVVDRGYFFLLAAFITFLLADRSCECRSVHILYFSVCDSLTDPLLPTGFDFIGDKFDDECVHCALHVANCLQGRIQFFVVATQVLLLGAGAARQEAAGDDGIATGNRNLAQRPLS